MNPKREQVADIIFTAATIGAGVLLGSSVMAGVVGASLVGDVASTIGGGLATNLTAVGWDHARQRLLGESGLLNHDLQKALSRAFAQAIEHIEQAWWQTSRGHQTRRQEPETAQAIEDAFQLLRQDALDFFTSDRVLQAAGNDQVRELLYSDETAVRQAFSQQLAIYLHGHDPQLIAFVDKHLVEELVFWFGEELKADRPESNRAWRAFQRLMLEGLQTGLFNVQANQQEMLQILGELTAWSQRMEARPPEERELTGVSALEQTLVDVRDHLVATIEQESALTRQVIVDRLDQLGATIAQPEIPPPPAPTRPPEVTDFVGRETELSHFADQLRNSHLAVISGMAGVGKTALASALIRRVADPYRTFWHSFHEGEGIDVVVWKLAGFLAWQGQVDLWEMLQSAHQTDGQPPPPETLFDYLLQMMRGQRYLLCLDDFQFVDEDPRLRQLVDRLRDALLAGDLSLIITSRRVPASVKLAEFEPLGGLSLDDVRRMLAAHEITLSDDLIQDLYASTGGNAQFLTLAVDALKWATEPAALIDRLAEADDIERYLLQEVDGRLVRDERMIMSAVSVLQGYPGTRDVIEATLNAGSVLRTLRDLSDRHLLIVSEGEAGREYVQHSMVQAFFYEALGRRQKRDMHRRAGAFYDLEAADVFQAALHYQRAGEHPRAAELATEDVSALINQGLAQPLRRLLERFRPHQVETKPWAKINIARGQVYAWVGKRRDARDSYEVASSQLAKLSDTPAVYELRARVCHGMGELLEVEDPQEALHWLQQGLNELTRNGNIVEEAALHVKVGEIHMTLANFPDALDALERGLSQLPKGPSQLRATALMNLGAVDFLQGNIERAEAHSLNALEISRQLHDHFRTAQILTNLGMIKYVTGDWTGGIADFQQAVTMTERLGNEKKRTQIEMNLGKAFINIGDDEAVLNHLETCLNLARKNNDRLIEIATQCNLADLYIRRGEWELAEEALHVAEQLTQVIDTQSYLPEIYRGQAEIELAKGHAQAALDLCRVSIDLAERGNMDLERGISLRVMGKIQIATDKRQPAWASFEESLRLLDGQDPYESARTKAQWGIALLATPNKNQGGMLLQEARSTFQELGAKRDLATLDEILRS